jgi:amidophosphoribosyltransferase
VTACVWVSEHVLKGKIVIVVDDSIVRGTTARQLVGLIYGAGAKEVRPGPPTTPPPPPPPPLP